MQQICEPHLCRAIEDLGLELDLEAMEKIAKRCKEAAPEFDDVIIVKLPGKSRVFIFLGPLDDQQYARQLRGLIYVSNDRIGYNTRPLPLDLTEIEIAGICYGYKNL
jgi:hypothetical protein